jgi:hypothetical protein
MGNCSIKIRIPFENHKILLWRQKYLLQMERSQADCREKVCLKSSWADGLAETDKRVDFPNGAKMISDQYFHSVYGMKSPRHNPGLCLRIPYATSRVESVKYMHLPVTPSRVSRANV